MNPQIIGYKSPSWFTIMSSCNVGLSHQETRIHCIISRCDAGGGSSGCVTLLSKQMPLRQTFAVTTERKETAVVFISEKECDI